MKTLQKHLMEAINESSTFPLAGAMYTMDLIEFAAKFNNYSSNDEDDWNDWNNVYVDRKWAMDNKPIVRKFCELCRRIINSKITMTRVFLGNFHGFDDCENPIALAAEIGCRPGDYMFRYCTDGDNGDFFIMYCNGKDKKVVKLIDEFERITHDPAGWNSVLEYVPEDLGD